MVLYGGLVVAATGSSTMHVTSPTKPGEFPAIVIYSIQK